MPSAYEKGCAWILPCWWQTVVSVSHFAVSSSYLKKILKQNFSRLRNSLRDKWVPSSYSLSYSRNPFGGRQCNNPSGRTTWGIQEKSEAKGRVVKVVTKLTFIWNQMLDALMDAYKTVLDVSLWAKEMYWSVLKGARLSLDTRKKFFTKRLVRYWNRWHKGVLDAPSLEVLKDRLDGALSCLV